MHAEPSPSEATCPKWCNGIHDHMDERVASPRSDASFVPAVERRPGSDSVTFDRVAAGDLTAEALAKACLDRIAERDDAVLAWRHLDPDAVLDSARALDLGLDVKISHSAPRAK